MVKIRLRQWREEFAAGIAFSSRVVATGSKSDTPFVP
jgi:hypothetical protein